MIKRRGHSEVTTCRALVDTGADLCVISEKLRRHLSLPQTRTLSTNRTGHIADADVVEAAVEAAGMTLNGGFLVAELTRYDVILGLDFLQHFELEMRARDYYGRIRRIPQP